MSKSSVYFHVRAADDKHNSKSLKQGIDSLHGILSVSIGDDGETVAVDYDSTGVDSERIIRHIQKLGFEAQITSEKNHIM